MFNLGKFDKLRNTALFVAATMGWISTPAFAQTQEQLSTCKAVAIGLANVPESIVKVSANTNKNAMIINISVTKPWKNPGHIRGDSIIYHDNLGECEFDYLGLLTKIDTFVYSAKSPSDFQDFGKIPGLGRFIVIRREAKFITGGRMDKSPTKIYYSTIGQHELGETSVFPVLVNDKQQRWYAECNDKYIGQLSPDGMRAVPLRPNTFTDAVMKLVCAR
jgi:hypothetical protein